MEYALIYLAYRILLVAIIAGPAILGYRAFMLQANDYSKE